MDALVPIILAGGFLLSLALGLWVALSLSLIAIVGLAFLTSADPGITAATVIWGSFKWDLTALPLFIWMGEILFRSKLSEDMFAGLAPWLGRLPGGLLHTNIAGCALFAAVSGSSAATTATVGRISLPELKARGYDDRIAIGTLAGSGTFGLLIPPSIILIVYGAATEQSIARLFMAGVMPGIMLAGLFAIYVMVWSMLNRSKMPPPEPSVPFMDKLRASRRLMPVAGLILGVIGSIYTGIAAPTEAAALGVALALVLSHFSGTLNWASFSEGLSGAAKVSAMIILILLGAHILTVTMGFTGIPRDLAAWIGGMNLSPYALLFALTIFFIVMGCFLDGISIVVLTTSIILPLVEGAGFDLIWFGIFLVIVVEMSQITPPVGFNLFVLQGLTGRNIFTLAVYALPFFLLLALAVVLLIVFPEIALWLPRTMNEG